jgi:hypothetical protein
VTSHNVILPHSVSGRLVEQEPTKKAAHNERPSERKTPNEGGNPGREQPGLSFFASGRVLLQVCGPAIGAGAGTAVTLLQCE